MREEMEVADPPEKRRDNTVFLLIIIMVLIVGMVVLWVVKDNEIYRSSVPVCTSEHVIIDLSEPEAPSLFADLTDKEIEIALGLLENHSGFELKNGSDITVKSTYVFSLEMLLPKKSEALKFLDENQPKPGRYATAVVFRGDLQEPKVEEYVIGPLLNGTNNTVPTVISMTKSVPFALRPLSNIELLAMESVILPKLDVTAENILEESFGAKFINCSKRCLSYYYSPVPTSSEKSLTRKLWLHITHSIEYHTLHPLDFHLLVSLDGAHQQDYQVVKIVYGSQVFTSLEEFVSKFKQGALKKIHIQFPEVNEDLYSTLNLRGVPFPREPSRRPFQLEPDGKRYRISGQKVQFMEWMFHYRMSTTSGPMLFDLRYRNKRIAYEISLQEIAVLSVNKVPLEQNNNFETTFGLLGTASRGLVPGADCPEHATFLPARHLVEGSRKSTLYQNALCIFEQETGYPLRRHHSFSRPSGRFYGGMSDDVMVMRTVLALSNYDYVIDFIFHLNGVMEVKVLYSGFVIASYNFNQGSSSGYQIHDNIAADVHYHAIHFKVDLDIKGKRNSFSVVDPVRESSLFNNQKNSTTVSSRTNKKSTEKEALYSFEKSVPKYLLFHNSEKTNEYAAPSAYRLYMSDVSRFSFPSVIGNRASVSWINNRLAVTKHRTRESRSSSIFSAWDGLKPVVNFSSFTEDNDNIKNEDLVAWVTMGTYHIPHTEDLPTMSTPGRHMTFSLIPHNYFKEDPSMSSRNSIRVDMTGKPNNGDHTVRVLRYSVPNDVRCVGNATDFYDLVAEDSDLMFVGDEA